MLMTRPPITRLVPLRDNINSTRSIPPDQFPQHPVTTGTLSTLTVDPLRVAPFGRVVSSLPHVPDRDRVVRDTFAREIHSVLQHHSHSAPHANFNWGSRFTAPASLDRPVFGRPPFTWRAHSSSEETRHVQGHESRPRLPKGRSAANSTHCAEHMDLPLKV